MAACIAAFYEHIKVGQCRSRNCGLLTSGQPFPEEVNRKDSRVVADLHFAPTETSRKNLLCEGVNPGIIYVTGNPVIDALRLVANMPTI